MRKRFFLAAIGMVVLTGLALTTVASSDFDGLRLRTNLLGFQEVPSVSTVARGSFRALVSEDGNSIDWTLSYRDLEAAVQQAHIHFGQTRVNGGITVFLCTNLGNGPAGIQTCPESPATITGTITAADVSPNIDATAGARAQGLGTRLRRGPRYVRQDIQVTLAPSVSRRVIPFAATVLRSGTPRRYRSRVPSLNDSTPSI